MIGKRIEINKNIDERGILLAINNLPFKAKRMFIISDVPSESVRGNHYSKTSNFLYVVLKGSCKVTLDNGQHIEECILMQGDGLQFPPYTWMLLSDFQKDTILCVLSDTEYKFSDYVSDYEEFKRVVREENV